MSIIPLFLILFCSSALSAETEDSKHNKRGIVGSGGWIGIPNPHSYGHGQPWVSTPSWRDFKFPAFDLAHQGLYGGLSYGRGAGISLPIGRTDFLKPVPVFITKQVVLEKPVPVPEPVFIEKPYHVPIPIEKIIHKPVPVPYPVPEAVPVPVKQPVAVPVQQPYPVPVKQAFPVPIPVPFPVAVQPSIPFLGPAPLPAYYTRGYGAGQFYPGLHGPPIQAHISHGFGAGFGHGFGSGFGHGFGHDFGHGHGYVYPSATYVQDYGHGHEHKKRSKNTEDRS